MGKRTSKLKTVGDENVNCLAGLKCPKCGSLGPLRITAVAEFVVADDGTDEFGDVEWSETSAASCTVCSWSGQVKDFAEVVG